MEQLRLENVRFQAIDGLCLTGCLFLPNKKNDTVIISLHGPQGALNREREQRFACFCTQSGLAYFVFNNRSCAILERFNKADREGKISRVLYGSANDNLFEGKYDIKGAVEQMKLRGYKKIFLLGHSLSCDKIFDFLETYGNKDVRGICLLSPADIHNFQKKILGRRYKSTLDYAKKNANKLELISNGILEITPKTFCEYAGEKGITRYTNYKKNFVKEWKNVPYNIFISFVGVNEVITVDPNFVFERIKNEFLGVNIVCKFYPQGRHSYGRQGHEAVVDIVDFVKNSKSNI